MRKVTWAWRERGENGVKKFPHDHFSSWALLAPFSFLLHTLMAEFDVMKILFLNKV
jgi:hypothetical protein